MTTFTGGPADNTTLMLRRAPQFLRVVVDQGGEIDALDQPEDTRKEGEVVYVYRRVGNAFGCFVSARGRGGAKIGGAYAMAKYEFLPVQPTSDFTHNIDDWQRWCIAMRNQVAK